MTARCPACRTRRATYQSMQAHIAATGHTLCRCGGYHFAHRPGGGACEQSSRANYYAALRVGMAEAREFLSAADLRRIFPIEGDT